MSPMETPDDSEPPGDEEVATVILRKIVVIEILLALAFALLRRDDRPPSFAGYLASAPRRWMSS
jgi:hypothetical protein